MQLRLPTGVIGIWSHCGICQFGSFPRPGKTARFDTDHLVVFCHRQTEIAVAIVHCRFETHLPLAGKRLQNR